MAKRVNCEATGEVYCLNGGTCRVDDNGIVLSKNPCDCSTGYMGSHCETPVTDLSQLINNNNNNNSTSNNSNGDSKPNDDDNNTNRKCTLTCQNGGNCALGQAPPDWLRLWPGDPPSDNAMQCICPKGYGGHFCEYPAEVCGDNYEHICLHGSKCVLKEAGGYACECSHGNCIHQQTDFCLPGMNAASSKLPLPAIEYYGGMAIPAFCLNGGKCRDIMIQDERHAACDCLDWFEGPRCEFIKPHAEILKGLPSLVSFSNNNKPSVDGSIGPVASGYKIMLWILLGMVLTAAALFGARQVRRIRRRQGQLNATINLQGFRDDEQPERVFPRHNASSLERPHADESQQRGTVRFL